MKVELIDHTKDCEKLVADAARTCYQSKGKDKKADERLIRMLFESGHTSVLEHIKFTFRIKGVSRVLTHQLVRHRMASYSQQSQRYVREEGELSYTMPKRIGDNDLLNKYFDFIMKGTKRDYDRVVEILMEEGYDEKEAIEDARYILPNATNTEIVVTMNGRALVNFFELRCCRRAQDEIMRLAMEMLRLCRQKAPIIFNLTGRKCCDCTEVMPCVKEC